MKERKTARGKETQKRQKEKAAAAKLSKALKT